MISGAVLIRSERHIWSGLGSWMLYYESCSLSLSISLVGPLLLFLETDICAMVVGEAVGL